MKSALLGALCVVVLCIILSLGLWPFHDPPNQVAWLESSDGIEFGRFGTVLGSGEFAGSPPDEGGSIEIWVRPDRWDKSGTLLALYRPQNRVLFALCQSLTDLELQIEAGPSKAHFYVGDALAPALQQKKAVFITVTSGQAGTSVYRDGLLIMTAPSFSIPPDAFAGRPILGDRPGQPDSFRGQIRALAIYDRELDGAQVFRHYRGWTGSAPPIRPEEQNIALYLFNEKTGRVIHNHVPGGVDLDIPTRYMVVDKIALEPFWREFDFSRSYWSGNLKNIVGFLPVGFCFYAWILALRPTGRATLLTVVLGFLVSLTIEVLQIFLSTRDSGTTDLFTNTVGTYLGIFCYREIYPMIVKRFPILGFMQATEPQPEANSKHPTHCSS